MTTVAVPEAAIQEGSARLQPAGCKSAANFREQLLI